MPGVGCIDGGMPILIDKIKTLKQQIGRLEEWRLKKRGPSIAVAEICGQ